MPVLVVVPRVAEPPACPASARTVLARFPDLRTATRAAGALRTATGADVVVRGERVTTAPDDRADGRCTRAVLRPRRLVLNVTVAILTGVLVGPPLGATTAAVLLGESPAPMVTGAVLLTLLLGGGGAAWAWAEHFQRVAGSTLPSRVEGIVRVTAPSDRVLDVVVRALDAAGAIDVGVDADPRAGAVVALA